MKKWLGLTVAVLGSMAMMASPTFAQSHLATSVVSSGGTQAVGGSTTVYNLNATVGQTIIFPINNAPTNTEWDYQGFWYTVYDVLGIAGVNDHNGVNATAGSTVLYSAPNPFSDWTNIKVILTKSDHVTLKLFNSLGQEMRTLLDENREAGPVSVSLSGHDLQSGQYQVQLVTSDIQKVITIMVVK